MNTNTSEIHLTAGDHDDTESYIVVMLSKQEMSNFSKDMFNEYINPFAEGDSFWQHTAQKIGSALWALYADQHTE